MSGFLKLGWRDFAKGLVVTVLATALGGVYNVLTVGGAITVEVLKTSGVMGVTAGLSYIIKNLLTNSEDQLLKPEPK